MAIAEEVAVGAQYIYWTRCSQYLSEENTLVLSEFLDEDAVEILVDVALSHNFREQCKAWSAEVKHTRERFRQGLSERQNKAYEDIRRQEASLRRALRDAVVEDVMKIFP